MTLACMTGNRAGVQAYTELAVAKLKTPGGRMSHPARVGGTMAVQIWILPEFRGGDAGSSQGG